ncbi:hypothetical protein COCNU_01G002530 [Cocos nucifera]|uniref:SDH C-terminal domain-containing protein n=1 Tax=Cocos nucifera TaxID=13894 RepID=A0A8K0MU71_COCNU|nr:hypothetical protein COCNU_01G002530 [Cocos nucifera]
MAIEGSTLLCVPLVAKTVEQMAADMAAAKAAGADLVEIRVDHLSTFRPREDLEFLLKGRPLPAIVTYRPKWEGGEYEGDDNQRFEALRIAMDLGAEYVDIELKVAEEFVRLISGKKPENFKLIVSSHNYQSTPSSEELGSLVARMQAVGADIVKIVTTAVDIVDVTRMLPVIIHCQQALRSYAVVFDAVYTPKVTRLLREAKESGAAVVSGLEMFIRQAMGQFELFTGLAAPESLMRNIISSL